MAARRRGGIAAIVLTSAMSLAACASVRMTPPTADGPRISDLQITPERATTGCPAEIRFHVDPGGDAPARAIAGWMLTRGTRTVDSGYVVASLKPDHAVGEPAVLTVTPERSGRYWYSVQVDDRAGRASNILKGFMLVDAAAPGKPPTCR